MLQPVLSDRPALLTGAPASEIRALLLDDNTFDRKRIRRMSTKTDLPITLDEAGSIAELDAAVARTHYDLILIDYHLPEGDGIQALDLLLRNPLNRDAGKIMITGNGGYSTAVEAMRAGCHDFLSKDEMNAELLRRAMLKAIETSGTRRRITLQRELQDVMFRDGLLAGLSDTHVQRTLAEIVRNNLQSTPKPGPAVVAPMDAAYLEQMVMFLQQDDEDDFVFH